MSWGTEWPKLVLRASVATWKSAETIGLVVLENGANGPGIQS